MAHTCRPEVRPLAAVQLSLGITHILHGPPMLVDGTSFGLVIYNHADMSV